MPERVLFAAIGEVVPKNSEALPANRSRGFFISAPMPSITFKSRTFGVDPMRLVEREQNRQINEQKRAEKRPAPTVQDGWSEARKAAEALFSIPEA